MTEKRFEKLEAGNGAGQYGFIFVGTRQVKNEII